MAREMEWWQASWSQEFSDDGHHHIEFGNGVLNVMGRTIVRLVGRSHLVVTMNEHDARAWPVNWGINWGGAALDPIDQANDPAVSQRWKIWSKHLAAASPSYGTTTTPGFGVSVDTYDFDVRGMKLITSAGNRWWLTWRAAAPFQAGEVAVWSGIVRAGYLLP